ncbi:hypothetical protein SERLA73DRAFT_134722, partial [Serpula lacrymans var. lacrymans S7.3]
MNRRINIATAPSLPSKLTTPAGAASPALIWAVERPPGYGKVGLFVKATAANPMLVEKVMGTANQAMPPIKYARTAVSALDAMARCQYPWSNIQLPNELVIWIIMNTRPS